MNRKVFCLGALLIVVMVAIVSWKIVPGITGSAVLSFSIAQDSFREEVSFEVGVPKVVDLTANSKVEIVLDDSLEGMEVEAFEYSSNPLADDDVDGLESEEVFGALELEVEDSVRDVLESVVLSIYYDEAKVFDAGMSEDVLGIYYYNRELGEWFFENSSDVNTTANYVRVNLSHLSLFGISQRPVFEDSSDESSSGESSSSESSHRSSGSEKSISGSEKVSKSIIIDKMQISEELFAGEVVTMTIQLKNALDEVADIVISATGEAASFMFFGANDLVFGPGETREVVIKIIAPRFAQVGEYTGSLIIESEHEKDEVGVDIDVLSPDGKLLDVKIQPLTDVVAPGEDLYLRISAVNFGDTESVDIEFDLQLIDLSNNDVVARFEDRFVVETVIGLTKNFPIASDIEPGKYMIQGIAYYSNVELEGTMQASSIAYVKVQHDFVDRKMFGIYLWIYLLTVAIILAIAFLYYLYLRWHAYDSWEVLD
jgi:hypothetical protein